MYIHIALFCTVCKREKKLGLIFSLKGTNTIVAIMQSIHYNKENMYIDLVIITYAYNYLESRHLVQIKQKRLSEMLLDCDMNEVSTLVSHLIHTLHA